MMRGFRYGFIVVVAAVAVASVSASGQGQGTVGSTEVFEYSWTGYNSADRAESYAKQWVEETYDIKINIVAIDTSAWQEKLNVLLASGEIPDLMAFRMTPAHLTTYTNQGVLAELPVETIRRNMPGYFGYIESFQNPRLWNYGVVDGKHRGLPVPSWLGNYRRAITWRGDWLLNVGITTIPQTVEEYETAFRAFRNNDPDRNGKRDTYGLTAPGGAASAPQGLFDEVFGAFGTFPYTWVEKDGQLVWGFTDPATKEALKVLARWYSEELIDPEFITDDPRSQGNDIAWKFSTGRVGYMSNLSGGDMQWDGGGHLNAKWLTQYPEHSFLVYEEGHYGDRNRLLREQLGFTTLDPTFSGVHPYVHGDPPSGPRGDAGMSVSGISNSYITFGRQLEREQPKFSRLLAVLDDIATTKESYIPAAIGEEGFTWEWLDDPEFGRYAQWRDAWLNNPDRQALTPKQIGGFVVNPFWVSIENQYFSYNAPVYAHRLGTNDTIATSKTVEQPLKVALPSQARYADINKVLDEFFYEAILGRVDIDSGWERVVAQWKASGGDVLTKEANDWFATVR